jgi:FAD/FMN-containing dehydrogenase
MLHGETQTVHADHIEQLASRLRGKALRPNCAEYDQSRTVWNGSIDRKPALIVQCAGVSDIRNALDFAHSNDLAVAVKGGGHNVAGNAVCEGGLMIDLALMKGMRVDAKRKTAQSQAGMIWREFDLETSVFGLATTGGTVSMTGVAGLTLGGGFGWLMPKYGLTCDNLLSADVVLADGQLVVANEQENADLFWALRGGGGNFGIVTSFEFQLHPVKSVTAGFVVYPMNRAHDLLRFYREYAGTVDDDVTVYAVRMTLPDGTPAVVLVVCYMGPEQDANAALKPVRDFGTPLVDTIAPMPYVDFQKYFDAGSPAGMHQYWKTNLMPELTDDALKIVEEAFEGMTSPYSFVFLEHLHGAVNRVAADATAFPHRDAKFNFTTMSTWTNPPEAATHIEFARKHWTAMLPYSSSGGYVNYLSNDSDEELIRGTFGKNYDRLAAVKAKYDPTNFFHLNQNVKPAGAKASQEGR